MACEICGLDGKMFKAIVEDAELKVCQGCSKFGKVVGQINEPQQKMQKMIAEPEKTYILVDNFPETIRKKRESLNLTQEEFAKKISEKESLVHKIESGSLEPSLQLAKKIERFLSIRLIEEYEEKPEKKKSIKLEGFTLGDFIKIKSK